jgi:hypothetical protein
MDGNAGVQEMLQRIVGGEAPGSVLDSIIPPGSKDSATAKVRGGRAVCIVCGDESETGSKTCRECGSATAAVKGSIEIAPQEPVPALVGVTVPEYLIPEPLGDEPLEGRQYALADLRPNDRFRFTKVVPSTESDLTTEYQIVPARRGAVAFSDQSQRTFTVALKAAHLYPIKLMSDDSIDPGHRFYPGDRVKHRVESWKGVVLQHLREGYYIKPLADDGVNEDDGKTAIWVAQAMLKLVDKPITTRNYIKPHENGLFRVQWGSDSDSSVEGRMVDALRILYTRNRVAFNRYSRWMSEDGTMIVHLDESARQYLARVDAAFWGNADKVKK